MEKDAQGGWVFLLYGGRRMTWPVVLFTTVFFMDEDRLEDL